MTDRDDRDLDALDRAARAASRDLHAHVDRHVDPEVLLGTLPTAAPHASRGRLLAAAAVAALLIGSVAVLGDGVGDRDDRSRLELDEDGNRLPAPEPGTLTPLGPNDGRDSIRLPITVEPSVDLRDGQTVEVRGSGFVAGERVGIVQCAREAGAEAREERAGVDGCDIGWVEYADADADGGVTGTFTVRRELTTPATGTVDCASEPERCSVGMGALNDYDRSGGMGLVFAPGGEPIDIPSVTVSPAEGLSDGDVVRVEGDGFGPGPVVLQICALDPSGCWQTGERIELDEDELRELGMADYGSSYGYIGLLADAEGHVEGEVPVWRFLPTDVPGSYIDCSVSRCALRVSTEPARGRSPSPPLLGFASGGPGPRPPAIAASPTRDLEVGDEIVVRGSGFVAGDYLEIQLCATPVGDPVNALTCHGTDMGARIRDDGTFAEVFAVPDLGEASDDVTATTACSADGGCTSVPGSGGDLCDGIDTECWLRVWTHTDETSVRPQFPPAPISVTFR